MTEVLARLDERAALPLARSTSSTEIARSTRRASARSPAHRAASDELWQPHVRHDQHERARVLLHRRDDLDVWLLCWLEAQETGSHDHDRSAGAFYVCEGALVEDVLRVDSSSALGIEQTAAARRATSRGFDGGHVHGVRHLGTTPGDVDPRLLAGSPRHGPLRSGRREACSGASTGATTTVALEP